MTTSGWLGLDAGHVALPDLEHAAIMLADTLGCVDEVCTHALSGPDPHYAATLRIPGGRWTPEFVDELRELADGAVVYEAGEWALEVGDAPGRAGARTAIAAHVAGVGGRAIRFVGQADLRGEVDVDEVLAVSAISDVHVLGAELVRAAVIETRNYLRPQYLGGALTLVVTPMGDGRLQPFELEHAHQCCDGH